MATTSNRTESAKQLAYLAGALKAEDHRGSGPAGGPGPGRRLVARGLPVRGPRTRSLRP